MACKWFFMLGMRFVGCGGGLDRGVGGVQQGCGADGVEAGEFEVIEGGGEAVLAAAVLRLSCSDEGGLSGKQAEVRRGFIPGDSGGEVM